MNLDEFLFKKYNLNVIDQWDLNLSSSSVDFSIDCTSASTFLENTYFNNQVNAKSVAYAKAESLLSCFSIKICSEVELKSFLCLGFELNSISNKSIENLENFENIENIGNLAAKKNKSFFGTKKLSWGIIKNNECCEVWSEGSLITNVKPLNKNDVVSFCLDNRNQFQFANTHGGYCYLLINNELIYTFKKLDSKQSFRFGACVCKNQTFKILPINIFKIITDMFDAGNIKFLDDDKQDDDENCLILDGSILDNSDRISDTYSNKNINNNNNNKNTNNNTNNTNNDNNSHSEIRKETPVPKFFPKKMNITSRPSYIEKHGFYLLFYSLFTFLE
jgi:hypothetical protein